MGPLQSQAQYDVVADLVEQARAGGGRVLLGGNPETGKPGHSSLATLVADSDDDNPLVAEEQFGPALPMIKFSGIDEVIVMANALETGLGASVWSANPEKAREAAARIRAGTVGINKQGAVDPASPSAGPSSPATAWSSALRPQAPTQAAPPPQGEPAPLSYAPI